MQRMLCDISMEQDWMIGLYEQTGMWASRKADSLGEGRPGVRYTEFLLEFVYVWTICLTVESWLALFILFGSISQSVMFSSVCLTVSHVLVCQHVCLIISCVWVQRISVTVMLGTV